MSILIKGMKFPKRCPECPFLNEDYDVLSDLLNIWCALGTFQFNDIDVPNINNFYDKIKEQHNCPLIEMPPHGRLIDADRLINYQMTGKVKRADNSDLGEQTWVVLPHYSSLSEIPTVLEADYEIN